MSSAGPLGRLRIGLSANVLDPDPDRRFYPRSHLVYAEDSMTRLFARHGALVFVVPLPDDAPAAPGLDEVVAELDAVVLTGGADIAPETYGQEPLRPEWAGQRTRDVYEIDLVRAALDAGKPVLGICRGHQLLNVALGGTLWQDIATQTGSDLTHRSQERYHHNRHDISLVEGSALAALYPGRTRATVNSVHHQAIAEVAPSLVIEATCPIDGVIEAVRLAGSDPGSDRWAVGVQWHPEFDAVAATEGALPPDALDATPIVEEFLAAARHARERRS